LLRKVRGEEITWDGNLDFEVYGEKAHWEIFGDLDGEEEEKHLHEASGGKALHLPGCSDSRHHRPC
jgi:hypothetical protein